MTHDRRSLLIAVPLLLAAAACGASGTGPVDADAGATALSSVLPRGGATDVELDAPVEVRFDHPMMPGMEAYALLHREGLTGPIVDGEWRFSEDRTALTFHPTHPLEPQTGYTIHLGGGMMDADGRPVEWETHGPGMGGSWATEGMMGPGMGMGGAVGARHMGAGWSHANGSYGMAFGFTTGA